MIRLANATGSVVGGLAAIMLAGSVLAQGSHDELRLGSGDIVEVSILNRPELSGQFRIRVDGTISMHFLGELAATGITESDLERTIEDLLERQTTLPTSVTVEVAEWRSVTVAGDVTNPGSQEFEIGQTVAVAVSLAGGAFPRLGMASGSSLEVRIASEFAEIDRRKILLADLHARRIRLEAEASGLDRLESDTAFEAAAGDLAQKLLEAQTAILTAHRNEDTVEIASSRDRSVLASSEVRALEAQEEILRITIAESEDALERAEDLLSRGLSNADRSRNVRRVLNEEKVQLMEAASFKARALQQTAQAEASIDALRARRQSGVANELYTVLADTESTLGAIAASRSLLASIQPFASSTVDDGAELAPPHYRIRRAGPNGKVEVLAADLDTRLKPGDVLEVKRGGWLEGPTD